MLSMVVRAGTVVACAGLLNAAVNRQVLARPPVSIVPTDERVSVCIPARNEEHHLPQLLADLLRQRGVPDLGILVLDDASTDATRTVTIRAAGGDPRVHVRRSTSEPPAGWLGKPAACRQLAELALGGTGQDPGAQQDPGTRQNPGTQRRPSVLVFLDADVRLAPDAIAAGVALLRKGRLDLVCPWPAQRAGSALERLIQPLQQWSWLTTLPLLLAGHSVRPSMAAACGQFLVVDATAYARVGGHAAVAGCVLDDLELARTLRRHGYRTAPADGSRLAQCRMYTGAAELRAGYGKSLWTAFGPPAAAAALGTVLVATYVLPPAVALLGSGSARRWGLTGYCAAVGSRLISAGLAGTRAWPDALAHPFSVLGLVALTVDSHCQRRRGTLRWKGRHLG